MLLKILQSSTNASESIISEIFMRLYKKMTTKESESIQKVNFSMQNYRDCSLLLIIFWKRTFEILFYKSILHFEHLAVIPYNYITIKTIEKEF